MSDKVSVRITKIWAHTDHLFSFQTERPPGFRFTPGQFVRLGVTSPTEPIVWRAYSIVSGPFDAFLEFYSILVPGGAFTTELARLREGDTLWMEPKNHGFLTLDRFALEGDLWLLASGTGIAPFLSMLEDPLTWESFDKIILVHSVREASELAYREKILGFKDNPLWSEWASKLHYQPVITRASPISPPPGLTGNHPLYERIPRLIETGQLEAACGSRLCIERSKVMLCGNPEMVSDCRKALKSLGFVSARSTRPGQIATENYW